jgi:DNA-binding NarL/FixJ family response regulator
MPRILVADDHALMRRGVREVLEHQEDWHVCGEAATGREAVALAARQKPDVVVLDVTMPELNGLEAARQILQKLPQTEVLILTMHEAEELMQEVVLAGARACVLKSDLEQHLVAAVRALLEHSVYFSSNASKSFKEAMQRHGTEKPAEHSADKLTDREREIVQLLAQAKSNKETAKALGISVKTVETHRAAIMRKLGINSIVELVHYAFRKKLVEVKPETNPGRNF